MKKIDYYNKETPYDFHKKVVEHKRNANAAIVAGMHSNIQARFETYQQLFNSDHLETLVAQKYTHVQCAAMRDMYSYSAKPFRELKSFYIIDGFGRINDTCPNCQLDTITSFDHLVPQSEFPEFSDNTLNLIPCCVSCNGHKNAVWRENGKRKYLNLFVDIIPNEQYLYAVISIVGGRISAKFEVKNNGKVDPDLFDKIQNHYSQLDLLNRYKSKSDQAMVSLATTIQNYMNDLPDETIKKRSIEQARLGQSKYGLNYWKSVLELSALNDNAIFNYLKTCTL